MLARALLSMSLVLGACRGGVPARPAADELAAKDADHRFESRVDQAYWEHLEFRPQLAIELGYHDFDGRVPDRSGAAIAAEVKRLRTEIAWLETVDRTTLSEVNRIDLEVLLAEFRRSLFDLDELRRPFREPMFYLLFDFSLAVYVDRDYAPLETRARALLTACRAAPGYYAQMLANLDEDLSRPALMVGSMMAGGTLALVDRVLRAALAGVPDDMLRANLDGCLTRLATGLKEVQAELAKRMPTATDAFALGPERFSRMLAETQGFDVDLATLTRIGEADLARNLAALESAARAIDPEREPREVIAEVTNDKPDPSRVLEEATRQMHATRAFVVAHRLATIPTDDIADVRAAPPHRRGNFASLSSAGPFEPRPLPSFYYLAPPDPAWPEAEQRAYLPSRADLLFVTAHEVWPGHFLQGRHIKAHGSRIMQSFETYSTSEGWAHYAEEMMWEAGLGDGDPRVHIGQLKNALLRNVRFLVAIGMHTQGMTVDEATAMFADKAFADPQNARQQALRGTADPMYLSYTLGKLAIMKLRADWQAAQPGRTDLQSFHDAFLRYGEAPLPAIRRYMLGETAGPAL
jgi:hypothetical protein